MSRTNRIKKFIKQSPPHAKCVVVSDVIHDRVIMSYHGNKFLWSWQDGLLCPGSSSAVDVHPLAAEALIVEEIMSFIRMEGIVSEEIIYINPGGEKTDGIVMNPNDIGDMSFDILIQKEKVKDLYERFISDNDSVTEEMIGEAISFGVLTPFLSLVNLNL